MLTEYTNASTTQLLDYRTGAFNTNILDRLGIPAQIFTDIVYPGTFLDVLSNETAEEKGFAGMKVYHAASHDTASAVVAVPVLDRKFVYISCGTWSLIGTELDSSVVTEKALKFNFTNEAGVGAPSVS